MDNGIIIIINLQGKIDKSVAHTSRQSWSYSYTDTKTGKTKTETRQILHTDRGNQQCYKRLNVSQSIVDDWINGKCPSFVPQKIWKSINPTKKLLAYVTRFDEGFGVTYEEV